MIQAPSAENPIGPERIRELLSGHSPADGAGSPGWTVTGPVFQRANSRIFRAERDGFDSPLAVKICFVPGTLQSDPASARLQFDALSRVHARMNSAPGYDVPRPYLLREADGVVASEWVAGRNMTEMLFAPGCSPSEAEQLMARAGRWLRHFHAAHELPAGRLDVEAKTAQLRAMARSDLASDSVFARGIECLRIAAAPAGEPELARSWIHGDFKTDNLLVSGARTAGIDVALAHENPVLYDVAPFINQLELNFCHPRRWRSARVRRRLRQVFIETYFGRDGAGAAALPLSWVRLYLMLSGWLSLDRAESSLLRLHVRRWWYRKVAKQGLGELEQSLQRD